MHNTINRDNIVMQSPKKTRNLQRAALSGGRRRNIKINHQIQFLVMLEVNHNLLMTSNNARGIHVLLVDTDVQSLTSIARMLEFFSYKVTVTQTGGAALSILSNKDIGINLVLTDIGLPDINGFVVLNEAVRRQVPILLMSVHQDPLVMRMAIQSGASFFFRKPLKIDAVKDLWQHAVRVNVKPREVRDRNENGDSSDTISEMEESEIRSSRKKRRIPTEPSTAWTNDLHDKFVHAMIQLGNGNCYPKEIAEKMNVPGLTRMHVASHLQKCRDGLWRNLEVSKPEVPSNSSKRNGPRKFGLMPRFLNLPPYTSPSARVTEPVLRLEMGPISQDTASSSRYGTNSPTSNGSSVEDEFRRIESKLGKTKSPLKICSSEKEQEGPEA